MAAEIPLPKRPLTEDKAAALFSSESEVETITPTLVEESLADQIRARSARIREAVQRGYASDNAASLRTSAPRTKSLPNGNIFRSSNDLMRDVYSGTDAVPPARKIMPRSASKRALDAFQEDEETERESEQDSVPKTGEASTRSVRSLKKASLSTPSAIFSARPDAVAKAPSTFAHEEEDWSVDAGEANSGGSGAFEPMVL